MNEGLRVDERRSAADLRSTAVEDETPVRMAQTDEPTGDTTGPLLPSDFTQDLRVRWNPIQAAFVDEPRSAVQQADELVKTAIQRLSESFTRARETLDRQWDHGDDANTEELRLAFQKYRAFFQRILSV